MKPIRNLSSKILQTATGVCLLSVFLASNAKAGNDFFQPSPAPTAGSTYLWSGSYWATTSGGALGTWTPGSFAEFPDKVNYSIDIAGGTYSMAGFFYTASTGNTLNLTNSSTSGSISIPQGTAFTQNGFTWYPQGVLTDGGTVNIYANLSGSGGFESEQSGNLGLFGSNSFTGGFYSESSSTFVEFNNDSSFGAISSQILVDTGNYGIWDNVGPTSVVISNAVQCVVGGGTSVNFIGNGCTWAGNWNIGAQNFAFRNNGASGSVLTLGGVLSACTQLTFSGANGAHILLTNANTYPGPTIVGVTGDANLTLEIAATGSIASTTISNFGILKLDAPTCLKTNAVLQLSSSAAAGSVNLNFSGTQPLAGLYIGGVLQTGGTWGSPTSGAQNTSSIFTGSGLLGTPAAPSIVTQPLSLGRLTGGSATFGVNASGAEPFTYQWFFNGSSIGGANAQTYTINPVGSGNVGGYSVIVSNSVGSVTSSVAELILVETNVYSGTIAGDGPISYWMLNESNGSVAYDCIGTNNGSYSNVLLGQPSSFLGLDPDTAIGIPGAIATNDGFVNIANYSAFNWAETTPPGTFNQLSIEGWVAFTNLNGSQRLLSCGSYYDGGFGFGISGGSTLQFTTFGFEDYNQSISALTTNVWYYIAVTYDYNNNFNFYLNGNLVGTVADVSSKKLTTAVSVPVCIGGNGPGYWGPFAATNQPNFYEHVQGYVDQVAVYNQPLNSTQIMNHYNARFGSSQYPVVTTPIVSPTTTYESLSATFTEQAGGPQLSYQWYASSSGAISGANNSSFTLDPLSVTNSDTYYCQVMNPAGTSNSPTVALTVLPIPTNASQLNLTNSLVLHLPFDSDENDYSGRGHNGTAVGAPYLTNGVIGTGALHYFTDTNAQSTNYVTLGKVSDLQFGSSTDFSVSMWVHETGETTYTNLPFLTDALSVSNFTPGYTFSPYSGTNDNSQPTWVGSIGGTSTISIPNAYDSFNPGDPINDGNWHNLIFVASRTGSLTVYVDGTQVDAESDSYAGNINTANATVIGQDALGQYGVTGAADIDDVGVWARTLSQFEVSGIYLAGISNGVSFAAAVSAPSYVTLSAQVSGGQLQLTWPGGGGNLQASTNVMGGYTNVPGASSPYTTPSGSAQMFYRLHP